MSTTSGVFLDDDDDTAAAGVEAIVSDGFLESDIAREEETKRMKLDRNLNFDMHNLVRLSSNSKQCALKIITISAKF